MCCAGAFSFFMLFLGKVALCNGGFTGFLCIVYFSMYVFSKSQVFICGVNCIFLLCLVVLFYLCFVCVWYKMQVSKDKKVFCV